MNKKTTRLSKALASAGIASRRACEALIFEGRVTVNGEVVKVPQTQVTLGQDRLLVDGISVKQKEDFVYFLLHKPAGYLCTNLKGKKKIVLDLFPEKTHRLFSVGRLDKETEGLLIMTNDGQFAQKLIHPSSNVTKEYVAKTNREISDQHLKTMAHGTTVQGTFIRPVSVRKVRRGTVKIVVKEGKKHEVREIVQQAGLEVLSLKRTRIGQILLGSLSPGAFRPLTAKEKRWVFSLGKKEKSE